MSETSLCDKKVWFNLRSTFMKIRIKQSNYRNEAVIELLNIAIDNFDNYNDIFLRVIVRDAKLLASDCNRYIYSIDRRVLRFSSELSLYDREKLMLMDEDNLRKDDYQHIYNFFKRRKK